MQDENKTKQQLIKELSELRRQVEGQHAAEEAFRIKDKQRFKAETIAKFGSFVVEISTGEMKWSDYIYIMLGFKPGEIRSNYKTFMSFVHPDDQDSLTEASKKVFAGEADLNMPYRILRKDGQLRFIHTQAIREFDNRGKLKYIRGFSQDITSIKKAEDTLKESEEKYRTLLESMPYGFEVIDVNGTILYSNPAYQKMLGYTEEELLGKSTVDLLDTDEAREKLRAYLKILVTDQPEPTTYRQKNRRKDGRIVDQHIDWNYRYDNTGRVIGFTSVITNVTERIQSEEKIRLLSQITEQVKDSIVTTDLNHKITYVNEAFQELYGYSREEIIGRQPDFMNVSSNSKIIQENIYETVSKGQVWRGEVENIRKDGSIFICELVVYSIVDGNDNVIAYSSSQRDITERKRAEEELQVFKAAVETSTDAVGMSTPDGKHYYQNEAFDFMFGYVGNDPPTSLYVDEKVGREVFNTIMNGKVWTGEVEMYDKNKNIRSIHLRAYPVFKDSKIIAIAGIHSDITKSRQTEKMLLKEKSLSEEYINSLPGLFYVFDKQKFIRWNKEWNKITGYNDEELASKYGTDFFEGDDKNHISERMLEVFQNGASDAEAELVTKDGRRIPYYWTGIRSDIDGEHYLIGLGMDISERKRLQDLESRAERLEMAGIIAGQVAHDFNNLLAPLMAYPDLIREDLTQNHPALTFLDQIEKAAQKIADINQQLLTLGRRGHYNQEPLNLNNIVIQAVKDIQPLADKISFENDLDPDLMNLIGGGAQIHRVITNLLCNAIDALQGTGHITIRTENYYADDVSGTYGRVPKGEYVKLTISDNGCGISPDIVQKIIDPFFSTKSSDKKRGSGLGLSVVDAVVKDHNGYLDLKTQSGKGTSFYIYFPATRKSCDENHSDKTSGGSEKILVIDDDEIQREVSTQLLNNLGYEANSVDSGEKAIEFLRENPHDLVILDMIMPGGIDGAETYRQILEINPTQKAIIISGFSESDRVSEAQKLGAGAFVKKPLTKHYIDLAIRKELDKSNKTQV